MKALEHVKNIGSLIASDNNEAIAKHTEQKKILLDGKTLKFGEALVNRLDTVFPGFKKRILNNADRAKTNAAYALWGKTVVSVEPELIPKAIEVMAPQVYGMHPNIGEWITALKSLQASAQSIEDYQKAQVLMEEDRVRANLIFDNQIERAKYLEEKLSKEEFETLKLQAIDNIVEVSGCSLALVEYMRPLVEATMFEIIQPESSNLRKNWTILKSGNEVPEKNQDDERKAFLAKKQRGQERSWIYNHGVVNGYYDRLELVLSRKSAQEKNIFSKEATRLATNDGWLPDEDKEISLLKVKIEMTRIVLKNESQGDIWK